MLQHATVGSSTQPSTVVLSEELFHAGVSSQPEEGCWCPTSFNYTQRCSCCKTFVTRGCTISTRRHDRHDCVMPDLKQLRWSTLRGLASLRGSNHLVLSTPLQRVSGQRSVMFVPASSSVPALTCMAIQKIRPTCQFVEPCGSGGVLPPWEGLGTHGRNRAKLTRP